MPKKISDLTEKMTLEGQELFLMADPQSGSMSMSGDTILSPAYDYTDQKVSEIVNSAPEILNTLKELADALNGDADFAATVAQQIGAVDDRVDQEILDRVSGDSSTLTAATNPVAVGSRLNELTPKTSIDNSDLYLVKTSTGVASMSGETLINSTTNPQNIGTGTGVFAQKTGANIHFKTLKSQAQIQITSDSDSITIKNTTESSKSVSALNVDWSTGFVFYKTVAVSSSFTFSNIEDGKVISLIITNNGASTITITLPSPIFAASKTFTILAGKTTVCTFVSANSNVYAATLPNIGSV